MKLKQSIKEMEFSKKPEKFVDNPYEFDEDEDEVEDDMTINRPNVIIFVIIHIRVNLSCKSNYRKQNLKIKVE